jgi:zinc transport system permease protein
MSISAIPPPTSLIAALKLPWPFEREYLQLALVAGLVVGICAPLIGAYLVQRNLSLMGDGLGHLAFAGVGLALLTDTSPLWVALAITIIGALIVERIRARSKSSGDLALSLVFYSGLAMGSVLLGRAGAGAKATSYLFGSLLSINRSETVVVVVSGVVIVVVMAVIGRSLFAVLVDEEAAAVGGLPVRALNDVLMVLTALTVVVGMRTVGILLVSALMVLPIGASKALTTSFRQLLIVGSAIGVSSVVAGLVLSRMIDTFAGGTIVLVASAAFLLASLVGRRRR